MPGKESLAFKDLSDFTRGYVEAMLWTEEETLAADSENLKASGVAFTRVDGVLDTVHVPGNIGFDLIAPQTLTRIIEDCTGFELLNKKILDQCGDAKQNGQDFWLTRNGHGAGFWDRGYGEAGEQASEAARKYKDVCVYLGDDGKIYYD